MEIETPEHWKKCVLHVRASDTDTERVFLSRPDNIDRQPGGETIITEHLSVETKVKTVVIQRNASQSLIVNHLNAFQFECGFCLTRGKRLKIVKTFREEKGKI